MVVFLILILLYFSLIFYVAYKCIVTEKKKKQYKMKQNDNCYFVTAKHTIDCVILSNENDINNNDYIEVKVKVNKRFIYPEK